MPRRSRLSRGSMLRREERANVRTKDRFVIVCMYVDFSIIRGLDEFLVDYSWSWLMIDDPCCEFVAFNCLLRNNSDSGR